MREIPKIKLAFLGTTSSGKTCYMLGMYAHMQMGVDGFSLRATDFDQEIELTDKWDTLINPEVGKDRWPSPNVAVINNYVFEFSYGFQPVIQFEWVDYRGGALAANSTEKDQKELFNYTVDSKGIWLCVSGEHFIEKLDVNALSRVKRKVNINAMNWLLTDLRKKRGDDISKEKPFPVTILITKYDLCAHRERDELVEDIKKMFGTLFGSGWLVFICPVTLGKDLANNLDMATITPRGVEYPMNFAVYTYFQIPYYEALSREEVLENRHIQQKRKSGFRRWWDDDNLDETILELSNVREKRENLELQLRLNSKKLKDLDVFLNGEKIDIND